MIRDIHEKYLAAGADLIETNTFGATTVAQEDYHMADLAREMNLKSAQLARAACDKYSVNGRKCYVAGALGPTPKTASISPDVNDPGARNVDFRNPAQSLLRADRGADRRRRGRDLGGDHFRHTQRQGRAVCRGRSV